MGYYYRPYYRSWRSRGWGAPPSKYSVLRGLFGEAVSEIRKTFLAFDKEALDELFSDYGAIYGEPAEKYARKTFPRWQSGATTLSGQTMERLVELVPPYLSPELRFSLLQSVLKRHKKNTPYNTVKINVKDPTEGFSILQQTLSKMSHDDVLAHIPENVMKAASWLYDDDITAARGMLAEAERLENDMIRSTAIREINLLKKTISTGQIKAASYSVEMPSGKLNVVAYTPSKCFVSTVCFGSSAPETIFLRQWRDQYLIDKNVGRNFIVWYYNHGEEFSKIVTKSLILLFSTKLFIKIFVITAKYYKKWRLQQ